MARPTRKEIALARQLDAIQRRFERRYEAQIFRALMRQVNPYIEAVSESLTNVNRLDLISPAPLADTLESLYVVAGTAYAEAMYDAIQPPRKASKEQLRANWRQFMRRFAVVNLSGLLNDINETSKNVISRVVEASLGEGLGAIEVARNLERSVSMLFKNRAQLIARTEMVKASNVAAMESSKTSDFMYEKRWVPANQERTRPDHLAMLDSEYIPMDQPFTVGGSQMMQPGDGSMGAGPEQICNCRCKVVFRIMRDADGVPIRK